MRGRDSARITSNTVRQVSANRCHLARVVISNNDSAARYVQIFNALSANVTLGTTVPFHSIQVGANSTIDPNFGDAELSTGLSYAVTTTELGNTGPTSVWVTMSYK